MKVIQLINWGTGVYGLGDDGKLYAYNFQAHKWELA